MPANQAVEAMIVAQPAVLLPAVLGGGVPPDGATRCVCCGRPFGRNSCWRQTTLEGRGERWVMRRHWPACEQA